MTPVRALLGFLCLAFCGVGALHADAKAEPKKAVLVELFTSQGCSSCPKANAFLGALSHEPDVLALTFAVGYWDYLGWRDTFAKPEYTARQKTYAKQFHRGVYTPQIVVDGVSHAPGAKKERVRDLMEEAPSLNGAHIAMEKAAGQMQITVSGHAIAAPADVWLAEYKPGPLYVLIKRGENKGVSMPHYNLVTRLSRLGDWNGATKKFTAMCEAMCAVIVQERAGGRVLAAQSGDGTG